jgi:hypothetical protein
VSIVACTAIGADRAEEHHFSVAVYGPLASNSLCVIFSRLLRSNGSTCHNIKNYTGARKRLNNQTEDDDSPTEVIPMKISGFCKVAPYNLVDKY